MKEFSLIAQLKPLLPINDYVVTGAGDDCAVLDIGDPDYHTLFKTDAVVEGVHFTSDATPQQIGHKALARGLSDIAAMGGVPVAALISLGLPKVHRPDDVLGIYRGAGKLAARYQVAIVGGETTSSVERMWLSLSLLGRVRKNCAILRSGAQPGDALFVTGELGGSIAGRHLDFEPRLHEGKWLAENFKITSMIDISDGLAGDLGQVMAASGNIGAELLQSALPISRAAKLRSRSGELATPAHLAALFDGEDFELLFSVPPRNAVEMRDAFIKQFPGVRLSCIGKMLPVPGLWLRAPDGVRPLPAKGYEHFE